MTTVTRLVHCPVCGVELPGPPRRGPAFCPRPSCGVEFLEGEAVRVRTFRLVKHYALLVLPFSNAFPDRADPVRRLAEAGRWRQKVFSADDPDDVDRTEYFLPYVRRFLFPTLYAAGGEPTCRHYAFDPGRLGPLLTLRGRDVRKKLSFDHRVLLEKAELIVFGYRVGFLVLRARCADEGASFFEQMDAVAYLRTIAPLYRGFEMPVLDSGRGRYGVPQLVGYLLAEFGRGPLLPGGPEEVAPGTPLPVRPVHDDRMMVYTFSCLDRDSCLGDPARCQALLHRAAVVRLEADANPPPGEPAEGDAAAWLRTRWQGFSKDGGSLVVFNTDAYHERYAGLYHGTYYFDVFLLAALQRVTLLTLFERLADIRELTRGGREGRQTLRRVRRDLLLFKNQ
jgi:hypothetical protein